MMVLIIGGSGSGKSAYAEEYIGRIAGKGNKYYLATMQFFDEEGKKKVARHQRLRKNKVRQKSKRRNRSHAHYSSPEWSKRK